MISTSDVLKNPLNVVMAGVAVFLFGCGQSSFKTLENVSAASATQGNPSVPILFSPNLKQSIQSVSASSFGTTCVLNGIGQIACFGYGGYDTLGIKVYSQATPILLDSSTKYKKISVGVTNTCGLTTLGVLKCFGMGGALGNGSYINALAPVVVEPGVTYKDISVGLSHVCGITSVGVLKCWGLNTNGQLGIGTITGDFILYPEIIDPGVSYSQISLGNSSTCAITSLGALKCWGYLVNAETRTTYNSEVFSAVYYASQPVPTLVDPGVTYKYINAGSDGTNCGITSEGVLKCWGSNISGQIGDGTRIAPLSPKIVDPGINYAKVTSAGWDATCGVTSTGILKCWGACNTFGPPGEVPTPNIKTPTIVDAGTSYVDIAIGAGQGANLVVTRNGMNYICGVTKTGILRCMGNNNLGQLGDGGLVDKYSLESLNPFELL